MAAESNVLFRLEHLSIHVDDEDKTSSEVKAKRERQRSEPEQNNVALHKSASSRRTLNPRVEREGQSPSSRRTLNPTVEREGQSPSSRRTLNKTIKEEDTSCDILQVIQVFDDFHNPCLVIECRNGKTQHVQYWSNRDQTQVEIFHLQHQGWIPAILKSKPKRFSATWNVQVQLMCDDSSTIIPILPGFLRAPRQTTTLTPICKLKPHKNAHIYFRDGEGIRKEWKDGERLYAWNINHQKWMKALLWGVPTLGQPNHWHVGIEWRSLSPSRHSFVPVSLDFLRPMERLSPMIHPLSP